ncbi:LCP family protein [Cryobacterium luteum]|uniref:LytR family transcriptional regulator n=1 Tax=Cryobacterium luteum TaxID=1424661 RepID=A0A1H8G6Z0_9MICO|nr:LCP family protein [Cryobacterium luteum]TFB93885.1 LytR family transcriptional regulator [Cryobacterium luteum]SEN39786.1 transcriptional attenuator, LytR family [Cryobacterium luteum]
MPYALRHQRRTRGWHIVMGSVLALVLLGAGAGGVGAYKLSRSFDDQVATLSTVFPPAAVRPPASVGAVAEAQNILVLGSDRRGAHNASITDLTGQRSDVIMVVHIPADREGVWVMSILRDSWLEIPGHGQAKINAALSWGGVPLAVETVEGLIKTRIDHVAVVDFEGFQAITDAVGGVEIDNPVAFASSKLKGHTFAVGKQVVTGAEALAYARERYAFADGDFTRVRNQQRLFKAMLSTVMSSRTVTNPATLTRLIEQVTPWIAVDDGLDFAYLTGLELQLRDLHGSDLTFFTLPTNGTGTSANGQSIVNIATDELAPLQEAFQTDTLAQYAP